MVDHNLIWNISQLSKQFTPKLEYNVPGEDSFDTAHLLNLYFTIIWWSNNYCSGAMYQCIEKSALQHQRLISQGEEG